jgi:hypothetical protein
MTVGRYSLSFPIGAFLRLRDDKLRCPCYQRQMPRITAPSRISRPAAR